METIKKLFIKYREITMYLILGVATTIVNWVTYSICASTFSFGMGISDFIAGTIKLKIEADSIDIFLANCVAWVIAVVFAYLTNKTFVFQSYLWKPAFVYKEFSLFISARFATGLLEIFGVPFLIHIGLNQSILGVPGMLSKIIISVFVIVFNYIFSKLIIFRKPKNADAENSKEKSGKN